VDLLEEFAKEIPDCNMLYMMFQNAEIFEFFFSPQRTIFCEGK
jgi:hypothetical protein